MSPVETAKEVTAEYVKQIIAAVQRYPDEGMGAEYIVTELLKEFGAKAYRQGRQNFAEQIQRLV